jgi:hypothetical protein
MGQDGNAWSAAASAATSRTAKGASYTSGWSRSGSSSSKALRMNNHGPADQLRIASVVSVMMGGMLLVLFMNGKCTNKYGGDVKPALQLGSVNTLQCGIDFSVMMTLLYNLD